MTKPTSQLLFFIILSLFSCTSAHEENVPEKVLEPCIEEAPEEEIDQAVVRQSIPLDSFELDAEPPFKYPCQSSFTYVGVVKVSESQWDEIQIGKGWDSRLHSCSYVWGEHINNNFPPESTITDFRMHLVDLDISQVQLTREFLNSKLFKEHLIVTTINGIDDIKTTWDPNKTGNYPKPKQWMK